jgi:hypothetical protein
MVVGTVPAPDLALSLRRARDLLGRQINPTTYTPAEFYEKCAAKDHFLTGVLSKPKLFVLGSDDELGEVTA